MPRYRFSLALPRIREFARKRTSNPRRTYDQDLSNATGVGSKRHQRIRKRPATSRPGRRNPAERTTLARAISSAWADQFLGSHIKAQQTPLHHTPGLRAFTNLANDRRSPQQGLRPDCTVATPDSSQTCITRARRPARIAREATLAAAILFGTLKAVAPNNQHHLCFLKRLSTVMPSVIQQEIVGARVEPRSTRNQSETSAGAQAPSDKLQTPAKGTALAAAVASSSPSRRLIWE